MSKLVILQTVVPDYRKRVFEGVYQKLGQDFILYAGDRYFEGSVQTDYSVKNLTLIKNHYLFNNKVLFQTGMWKEVLSTACVIQELNPRILSNWLILLIRIILNKKVILWGHAWPRSGKDSKSDMIRNLMRRMADEIIVYTESQAEELRHKMVGKTIMAAPNSLYSKSEMRPLILEDGEVNNFIYVGRLTALKKVDFLVRSFITSIPQLPENCSLLIVGDGELKQELVDLVYENDVSERVKLLGHIGDLENLRSLYASSIASISPGYVGLSITQSFGFGVPMIISKNENHSPEIEAAVVL
jgi:glycosyltransferase involved in cell wall biosynthesis